MNIKKVVSTLPLLKKKRYFCNRIYDIKNSSMSRTEILNSLREIIHKEAPSARVILYGSEARGEAGPESDIDLLILVDKDKLTLEDETKITYPIYELELQTGVLISPMVLAKKSWENRQFKTPFYINVMNEGIEL